MGEDVTKPVREEDSVNVEAVSSWLREHGASSYAGLLAGESAGESAGKSNGQPEIRQFPGGASNLTYLLRYPAGDLILRRPPSGRKAAGAHDMGREFRVQSALAPVFDLVPGMVGFCEDESVIGSQFYVMERVDGIILRQDFPSDWQPDPEQASELCRNMVDVLVELHGIDGSTPGLAEFDKGEGYVARQVGGWSRRFRDARTEDVADFDDVMEWLDREQPADVGRCLIHNDFRFDNLVLDPADPLKVIGVLDWEMATVGDPLMDLGGTLAYWVEANDDEFFHAFRRQPTTHPGMWTRQRVVDYYLERTGLSVDRDAWRFYEVFGLFRLAVIAQQIYYRYYHGQTTNEAYAIFGQATSYLLERCRGIIASTGGQN